MAFNDVEFFPVLEFEQFYCFLFGDEEGRDSQLNQEEIEALEFHHVLRFEVLVVSDLALVVLKHFQLLVVCFEYLFDLFE